MSAATEILPLEWLAGPWNRPIFGQIGIRQLDLNDSFMRSIWNLMQHAEIWPRPA
jgi:hypothetical protein